MINNYDELFASPPDQKTNGQQATPQPVANSANNSYDSLFANSPQGPEKEKQGTVMDMVDSFNATVNKFAAGEMQLFAKGLSAIGLDTAGFQDKLAKNTEAYQQAGQQARINSPAATLASDFLGNVTNVTATAAQGGGAGLGQAAPTVLGRVGQSAALSAGEGMLEYGDMADRAKKGAIAAPMGALGQGAGEALGYIGKEALSPLFKGGAQGVETAAQQVDNGASLTLGQATGRAPIQKAEATLAEVPVLGTKGGVINAANSVNNQVQDQLSDLGINKTKAYALAEDLKSGLLQAKSNAINKTNAAYDDITNTAEKLGIDVPLTKSNTLAKEIIDTATGRTGRGLKSAEISLNSDAGKVLDDIANNPSIKGGDFDFLRKNLKGVIDDAYKGGGNSKLIEPLQQLKSSMDEDLNSLGETTGNNILQDKILTARATHQTLKEPFNKDPFLSKLKKGEYVNPDQLLNAAVKNDSPYATNMIMKVLPKESQDTFTTALIQKTVKKATIDGQLDLGKLNTNFDKLGETLDSLPQATQDKVKGIKELITNSDYILKAAKPSSIIKQGIASGAGAGALWGAAAAGGWGGFLSAGVGLKALSSVMTNPKMVKQLIRLGGGKMTPKTKMETMKYIINRGIIPAAASGAAEDYTDEQPQ